MLDTINTPANGTTVATSAPAFNATAAYPNGLNVTRCDFAVHFLSFEVLVFGFLGSFINAVGLLGNILSLVVLFKGILS